MKLNLNTLILSIPLALSLIAQVRADTNGATIPSQVIQTTAVPFITQNKTPGVAIAIFYNGQDYYFNFGNAAPNTPVTKDTIFELASITKVFVATLLAQEVQAGAMNLSDPAVKYIPALAGTKNLPIDLVTLKNLATHTASFPRQMQQFGVAKGNTVGFINRLKTWNPRVPVGTQYKYSNIGFGLLGSTLEEATGQSLTSLLSQSITQPLGMNNTYFVVPNSMKTLQAQGHRPNNSIAPFYVPVNFLGGGALRSSSADMLVFLKANLGIKTANASPQLLSAMQFAQNAYFEVKPNFVMGLGWQRMKRGQNLVITKNGRNQGFNTFIGFSPAKKLGVVVLTSDSRGRAAILGNQILNQLLN